MLFAFITAVLFAVGAVTARLLVKELGSTLANFTRLVVATIFLAVWAYTLGGGTAGPGFLWFFLSGCIGFGLGDIALYFALPRIGARLTMLLVQCLAAPIAAVVEWLWLGTTLTGTQMLLGAVIIGGIALALVPRDNLHLEPGMLLPGVIYGIIAAMGQGGGAVVSRKAFDISAAAGFEVDGGTAAFQRVIGGVIISWIAWMLLRSRPDEKPAAAALNRVLGDTKLTGLLLMTALFGPVVGVAFFQWALSTAPSGLVLPIVALTPIVIIPFSYWLEGDRPKPRSVIGGVIAVGAAIALAMQ